MEEEVTEDKLYSFKRTIDNLGFIKVFVEKYELYLIEELDIDPFTTFTLEFSLEYWYLKYHLLRDKKILLTKDDLILFEETNMNIVFFKLSDLNSFIIECNDGKWSFKLNKIQKRSIDIHSFLKKEGYL